ncbi:MAG TPA: acetylglutamate kinase, partial [Candidatus Atribacteria bacterium]|nr:acetylglutamate kinase [Candidatus Atribacteria bacterium]
PYIQRFNSKIIVIKYGGSVMEDEILSKEVFKDIVLLKFVGMKPIVIHGGGKEITSLMKKLGIPSKFVSGHRITDKETLDIVEMILAGKINKRIVAGINAQGGLAIGLSGKDANLIRAEKLVLNESLDLGYVGEIKNINVKLLSSLIEEEYIPVISSIGIDKKGQGYNINADIVAGKVAQSLKAEKLIYLTDIEGVLDREEGVISHLSIKQAKELIERGDIVGGMLPKVNSGIEALMGGVKKVHIINGTFAHSILLELFTEGGIGTEIVQN